MRSIVLILFTVLFCSCVHGNYLITQSPSVPYSVVQDMNKLYRPYQEIAFCVSSSGVRNIMEGGLFWMNDLPLCSRAEIVMHTHPVWGSVRASIQDLITWDNYFHTYGNWRFGIMLGPDEFVIYERREDK